MSGVTDSTAAQTRWSVLILLHTTFLCARFSHINPPPRVIKGAASRVTSAAWMHSKSSTSRVARFGRWRHRFHSSSSPPHSRYACLVGTIPPKIGLLASMVVLVLGANRLSGRRSHVASLRSHDERPCLTKKARVVALCSLRYVQGPFRESFPTLKNSRSWTCSQTASKVPSALSPSVLPHVLHTLTQRNPIIMNPIIVRGASSTPRNITTAAEVEPQLQSFPRRPRDLFNAQIA